MPYGQGMPQLFYDSGLPSTICSCWEHNGIQLSKCQHGICIMHISRQFHCLHERTSQRKNITVMLWQNMPYLNDSQITQLFSIIRPIILDQLLTILVAFSTIAFKPSFSQSLSLHSHLCLATAHLLKSDHSVFCSHWRW